jgi:hypothetical protein
MQARSGIEQEMFMRKLLVAILICLAALPAFCQSFLGRSSVPAQGNPTTNSAQQPTPPGAAIKTVDLVGLAGVKNNTGGTLTVEGDKLLFVHSKNSVYISAATIDDVVTGGESQRVVRGTLGTISMFGPYGSGRFLSLFRSKLDSLTIQYRDTDGGLHGVVFTTPVGQADSFKKELVAQGAHTSVPLQTDPNALSSKSVAPEEKQ